MRKSTVNILLYACKISHNTIFIYSFVVFFYYLFFNKCFHFSLLEFLHPLEGSKGVNKIIYPLFRTSDVAIKPVHSWICFYYSIICEIPTALMTTIYHRFIYITLLCAVLDAWSIKQHHRHVLKYITWLEASSTVCLNLCPRPDSDPPVKQILINNIDKNKKLRQMYFNLIPQKRKNPTKNLILQHEV